MLVDGVDKLAGSLDGDGMDAEFCVTEGVGRGSSGGNFRREQIFREVFGVTVLVVDFITNPRFADEERYRVAVVGQDGGHGGAEGATTQDSDFSLGG